MAVPIDFTWDTDHSEDYVRDWLTSTLFPVLHRYGYRLEGDAGGSLRFIRRRSDWRLALISPLAFAFSPRDKDQLVVTIATPGQKSTRVTFAGELPKKVASVLELLPERTVRSRPRPNPFGQSCVPVAGRWKRQAQIK